MRARRGRRAQPGLARLVRRRPGRAPSAPSTGKCRRSPSALSSRRDCGPDVQQVRRRQMSVPQDHRPAVHLLGAVRPTPVRQDVSQHVEVVSSLRGGKNMKAKLVTASLVFRVLTGLPVVRFLSDSSCARGSNPVPARNYAAPRTSLLRRSGTYVARDSEVRQKPYLTCVDACGPGWDRTSDLPRVKRTLSH